MPLASSAFALVAEASAILEASFNALVKTSELLVCLLLGKPSISHSLLDAIGCPVDQHVNNCREVVTGDLGQRSSGILGRNKVFDINADCVGNLAKALGPLGFSLLLQGSTNFAYRFRLFLGDHAVLDELVDNCLASSVAVTALWASVVFDSFFDWRWLVERWTLVLSAGYTGSSECQCNCAESAAADE